MTDRTDLQNQVYALLQDTLAVAWTDDELKQAMRMALEDFSRVSPHTRREETLILSTGPEIPLYFLAYFRVKGLLSISWPWTPIGMGSLAITDYEKNNLVTGWRVSGYSELYPTAFATIFLSTKDGSYPKYGDYMVLEWAESHHINDLDDYVNGSLDPADVLVINATTLTEEEKALVVQGAAGYAAVSGALDRSEVLDRELLRNWGNSVLADFRSKLETIRAEDVRTQGKPFGGGWPMDKWDNQQ